MWFVFNLSSSYSNTLISLEEKSLECNNWSCTFYTSLLYFSSNSLCFVSKWDNFSVYIAFDFSNSAIYF